MDLCLVIFVNSLFYLRLALELLKQLKVEFHKDDLALDVVFDEVCSQFPCFILHIL